MKRNTNLLTITIFTALLALGFAGAAQAALHDRGGGLIYDDVLEITWLKDANYGAGSAYDDGTSTTDGLMAWDNAMDWAANLTVGATRTWSEPSSVWRLPTSLNSDGGGPCVSYNCSGSEMGHMFYTNMQGSAGNSILDASDPNDYLSLFENLQPFVYWSGTENAPSPGTAWGFRTDTGYQDPNWKTSPSYAWAVHDGNVNPVPIPAAAWLFGSGLIGLLGVARSRK